MIRRSIDKHAELVENVEDKLKSTNKFRVKLLKSDAGSTETRTIHTDRVMDLTHQRDCKILTDFFFSANNDMKVDTLSILSVEEVLGNNRSDHSDKKRMLSECGQNLHDSLFESGLRVAGAMFVGLVFTPVTGGMSFITAEVSSVVDIARSYLSGYLQDSKCKSEQKNSHALFIPIPKKDHPNHQGYLPKHTRP